MATTDDAEDKKVTTAHDIRNAVETAGSADESVNEDDEVVEEQDDTKAEADESKGDDSTDEDTDEDSDDEEDESKKQSEDDDSKPKDKSEYRFSQFAGDGKPETYIKNLEEGYKNSSAEAIRLNTELKQANSRFENMVKIIKSDPELDKRMEAAYSGNKDGGNGGTAPQSNASSDPFLVNAATEWREQSEKSAQEFIDANPEVVSDPKINAEVKEWMETISAKHYDSTGKLMTAGEAMSRAYRVLGYEDKREQRKSMSDAKKAAAPTRPQGSRKPAKTASDFTESQLDLAAQMGLSKEKLEKFAK